MKEMTLKEIQQYSLNVLLHVHEFCVTHDIPYTLAYGTLIGAARHKGFIPWDDDIDIIMRRENFERFLKEYQSDDNFMLVSPYDKKSYIAFARLCDMRDTEVECIVPWSKYRTGVWVDIFPIDGVSDNEDEHRRRWARLSDFWQKTVTFRYLKMSLKYEHHWKFVPKKMLYLNAVYLRPLLKIFMKEVNNPHYAMTAHCAQLACCDEWGYYEKKDFEKYTTLEFEGHQLMVIKEYDKVLRSLYGDYMQLPPEEEQVPKQASYLRFYLK